MDSVASGVQRLDALATSPVVTLAGDSLCGRRSRTRACGWLPCATSSLGRPVSDLDFTTPTARPDEILRIVVPLSGNTVGTWDAISAQSVRWFAGEPVEITTYRADARTTGNLQAPLLEFGDTLGDDLTRAAGLLRQRDGASAA